MSHEHTNLFKLIRLVTLAVGVGYTVGVLFAPRSGTDTRQLLAKRIKEKKLPE